jgi:hypothetical protein
MSAVKLVIENYSENLQRGKVSDSSMSIFTGDMTIALGKLKR